ncbi:MAG TPA: XrtA system polysaccharide deacetylase [Longimicrobiaceae bacterium]|nr:XrtA system polysaccharide deacetylase [Longimicrobiaceae bacterium]
MRHHFTVDVEEYFQVSAMEPYVPRDRWSGIESRVERSTRLILELMAERDARGTFFVLGWIAERHPGLVREIAEAGHEVASHGWGHRRVTQLTPDQFRRSVRASREVLEDLVGAPVLGYRAPSFSIAAGYEWALDVLLEEGYRYDSSRFPVRRRGYGFAGGARDPHWLERPSGRLGEVPPATLLVGGKNLPAGGGAYFRLFPYALVRAAFREAEARGAPATFYIHPWEVDPEQPRIPVPPATRVRHYGGLRRTVPRLRRLLGEFRFQPIAETLAREAEPCTAR